MPREPERRDELLMSLVEGALAMPPGEREEWVKSHCPSDPELIAEVLLRAGWEQEMAGFLTEPVLRQQQAPGLEPGQELGGRLRIVRRIAEGGMATVYQAEDEKIGPVAVKIPKPGFRHRLLAEARFALQVTHPNICRVHGFESVSTTAGEVEFLTMEYLEGETLQERIRREGPLQLDELKDLAVQLCAGLEEAHRRRVVHGDLKGSNVILTKRGEAARAVITDFGLAKSPGPGAATAALTSLRGTPDFLAPEIWRGGSFSAASDIYALGVLLYEAATGRRPFPDDPARRTGERLLAARRRRGDLPRRWNQAIEACLREDPMARPPSVESVAGAFGPLWSASPGTLILTAILVVGAATGGLLLRPKQAADPVRIAVLPIDADAESTAWGGGAVKQVSTLLPDYSSQGGPVVVVPAFDDPGRDPESRLKAAGATHLLKARFRRTLDGMHAELNIFDARNGQDVDTFSATYTQASMGSLPQALVAAVTSALHLKGGGRQIRIKAGAWPYYLRAQGELDKPQPDLDAAIAGFQAAAQLDPETSLPWAGMASALQLKYALKSDPALLELARSTLREATSRDPDAVEVHLAAGSVLRASGLPERAAAEYSRVLQIEPGNIEAMRRLAQSYADMNLPDQAMESWQEALTRLPNYYRTHLDLGQFYYYRARYAEAAEQFLAVTKLAPDVAMGYHDLGAVYNDLGRFPEAEQAFRRALALREHSDTLIGLGSVMDYQGRAIEAVQFYERAREVGPVTYLLLADLGDAYRRVGRTQDAQRTYQDALMLADRDLLERPRDGYVRAFVAYLCARLGDSERARRELAQALRFSPDETKVKRTAVLTLGTLHKPAEAKALLASEPSLEDEMKRHPDVSEFSPDLRSRK